MAIGSMAARAAVTALLALALTSCATPAPEIPAPGAPSAATPTSTPPSPAGSLRPAGPEDRITFLERFDIPSCGHERLGQGQELPATAVECLADPGADGAELIVTAPTTEGDPIVTYYRAEPGGSVEIWVDMTQDAYGGGWSHLRCPDARNITDLGECEVDETER